MNKVYAFIAFFAVLLLGVNAQIQDPVRFVVEQKKTGTNELEADFRVGMLLEGARVGWRAD